MANNTAFQAMGKTYQANATTTSQRIQILSDVNCRNLLVASHESNSGTGKAVYFAIGNSTVTCVAPAPGVPQYGYVAVPGQNIVLTVPKQFSPSDSLYIAFITESGTAECYFTPGEGL
jgi:hypothetical protein